MSDHERNMLYAREKKKLLSKKLTPAAYEQAIRNLCERLGL